MDPRAVRIAFFLTIASFTHLTSDMAVAHDKPEPQTQAPKSAEHATTGEENTTGYANGLNPKQSTIWPGMTRTGTVLLPNGWSLKPAGRQTKLGDLPVQIAIHPSEPILAILHAGYGEHEVATVDGTSGKVIARVSSYQFRWPGLVDGWQATLRRRRIRRSDLSV